MNNRVSVWQRGVVDAQLTLVALDIEMRVFKLVSVSQHDCSV